MNKVLSLTYASSLTNLCEVNSSFDTGILKIAYAGENRNGSFIDKATFERCIKTIYNCPIVCNYDRDTDTLGAHDVEVVRDDDGGLRLVNATVPVGCVPESGKVFWQEVEEDDGNVHEYLCVEVLLWKRQEPYRKIKSDGIVSQSMEITVKDGKSIDNIYYIYDFEFTAFALIGVTPCFESASLEFSKYSFKQQLEQMMLEIKESFSMVTTPHGDNDIHPQFLVEGGKNILEEKLELIAKYGLSLESLGFSIDDISVDALEEKLIELNEQTEHNNDADKFALEGNFRSELIRVLESEQVEREWGICTRYWFVDYNKESQEVYCWDTNDWLLYGFVYNTDGDTITVDYGCKKRKKYEIVDFDEGEQASPFISMFEQLEKVIAGNSGWESKFQETSKAVAEMESELDSLRKYKSDVEDNANKAKRDTLFAQFDDLIGNEAFEKLQSECADYTFEELEDKLFAIRGRAVVKNKFSLEQQTPKQKIDKVADTNEPYGGIFSRYGVFNDN